MLSLNIDASPVSEFSAAVPSSVGGLVEISLNPTRPVAPIGITVAVIFTTWLKDDGLMSVDTLMLVAELSTRWVNSGDVAPRKHPSPLYTALIDVWVAGSRFEMSNGTPTGLVPMFVSESK